EHPLNKLIAKLLAVFHSRYVVDAWDSAPTESISSPSQTTPATPTTGFATICDAGLEDPEATFGAAPNCETETAPQLVEPTPEQRKNMAALQSHSLIAHILHSYISSGDHRWPEDDVVPDPQAESSTKKPPRRTSASAGTLKHGVAPVPQADDPEDVPMPDAEGNDKLEGGSAVHDVPDVAHSDHVAEDLVATAPEDELIPEEQGARPAKRRRRGPVVQACEVNEPAAGDLPVRRVTRSRSAANVAAAALAQAAAALAAAAAPAPMDAALVAAAAPALAAAAPAPTAAAPLVTPAATVVQASGRLTRSKTGKLPKPKPNLTVAQAG
ncbi:hypothetical protein K466DRAFT_607959, partial [Polyporus arcularius HHB13444]